MGHDTGDGDGEKDLLLEQGVRGHPDTWIHLQRQESIHVRILTHRTTTCKDHSRRPEDSNIITKRNEWASKTIILQLFELLAPAPP